MKLKLKWWSAGDIYYSPLCDGDGYVPTFYIKNTKGIFKFIDIRPIHIAIKEQYLEVCGGKNGYDGGKEERDECNRLINLQENYKKSIASLFINFID